MKEFIPYGTPCDDPCESTRELGRDCIEKLENELKQLRAEVAALRAEREPVRRSGTED